MIREFPAIERNRKAKRLQTMLGKQVQEVELICDLRPIFDKKREMIEGFIPITILKLICEAQNEETEVIEVILDRGTITELAVDNIPGC